MKFTLNWLKDFLDTNASLEDITHGLNMLGLEVEEVINPELTLGDFTVGHITETEQHPNADRLKICLVDTKHGPLQIVCGAPNARKDIKVCVSVPGMYIPGLGITLKKGMIRGIESCGMLCSAGELGLDEALYQNVADGIMELPEQASIGDKVINVLGLNDPMIDIAITPNRPDALGVYGIARDLAAFGIGTLKPLTIPDIKGSFESPIKINVKHSESCPHFVGAYIKNVNNVAAPDWMQRRLNAIGCSTHSALVDITNYMSYSYARPLHVFDADKIGHNISADLAQTEEQFTCLKENEYHLCDQDIVIRDENEPLAMAGVMGGFKSGCYQDTQNVLLESAYFNPSYIAQTGRRYNIHSDARYRFERGIDPAFTEDGAKIALQMILDFCGGEISYIISAGDAPKPDEAFTLHQNDVMHKTSMDISWDKQQNILQSLGFTVIPQGQKIIAIPPSYRPDIKGTADLIEDIIRIEGINNIPSLPLPDKKAQEILSPFQKRKNKLQNIAIARGFHETISYSFIPQKDAEFFAINIGLIKVKNPIASHLSHMRPSILPSLLSVAQKNNALGFKDLRLCETGRVFHGYESHEQPYHLSALNVGMTSERHWATPSRPVDMYDIKGDLFALLESVNIPTSNLQLKRSAPSYYHPGRSAACFLGKNCFGFFGEIHPEIVQYYELEGSVMGFEMMLENIPEPKKKKSTAYPALNLNVLQQVSRDFAFIVPEDQSADQIIRAVKKAEKKFIKHVSIFDVYQGKHIDAGHKSIALNVSFQPNDKSFTDEELTSFCDKIIASVQTECQATLRG